MDRLDPKTTSYSDFFCDYLLLNRPCIFVESITRDWKSRREWIKSDGTPDSEFLKVNFGEAIVPVVDTSSSVGYDSPDQRNMSMADFLDKYLSTQDRMDSRIYLKDWHFPKKFPSYEAYRLPVYFRDDWMNEYWDSKNDSIESDYRFVYIGGKDTWTPFHADVFRSNSWSANICGRKRWLLVRPGFEETIRECLLGHDGPMTDIQSILDAHPEFVQSGDVLDLVQEPGEIIFVPSNWHHQVHNLDTVISINHNWCNATNIDRVWCYIRERLEAVKSELADCRSITERQDWTRQCQLVLKCDVGMDFAELLSMLRLIAQNRLKRLDGSQISFADGSTCDECSLSIVECQRTPECIHRLKQRLKPDCSCSCDQMCAACSRFFDSFDLHTSIQIAKSVLATEEAREMPDDFASGWNDEISAIELASRKFLHC